MCVTSSIGDYARDTMPGRYPGISMPVPMPGISYPWVPPPVDAVPRVEFEKLKAEVEELKILFAAAKRYDEKTGQHECEQVEKVAFLKKIAEFVGVDLDEVLGSDASSP